MKENTPNYNTLGHLVIPSAYTGKRLEKWLERNRIKPKIKLKTKPQQIMTARLNSGVDDGWCYNFIETHALEIGLNKYLHSKEILHGAQLLMRVFQIMAGNSSGRVFDNALASGDVEKAAGMASPANEKLLPIYWKAIREMEIDLVN